MSASKEKEPRRNPSRPAKRKHDVLIGTLPQRQLRLDELSDYSLQQVFRNMSRRPRLDDWQRFASSEDVLSLLRRGGRRARVARENFRALQVANDFIKEQYSHLYVVLDEDFKNLDVFHGLTVGLGGTLETLEINFPVIPRSISEWIAQHCTCLRQLTIASISPGKQDRAIVPILKVCGPRLEALALYFELLHTEITSIEKNCRSLHTLKTIDLSARGSLNGIWRSRGGLLRNLELNILSDECDGFARSNALENCSQVTNLSLKHYICSPLQGDGVLGICSKFGSKLRVLDLAARCMISEHFRKLREVCPNAQIDVGSSDELAGAKPSCMIALGETASSLEIGRDQESIENIGRIARACPNVKEVDISLDFIPVPSFRVFFEVTKPNLVKLTLYSFQITPFRDLDSFFVTLTEKVSSPEHFEYDEPVLPFLRLPQFLGRNQNMKKINLEITLPDGRSCPCAPAENSNASEESIVLGKRIWTSIVTPLLKNESLLEIDCSCSAPEEQKCSDFADMCTPARYGIASIRRCGYQYF